MRGFNEGDRKKKRLRIQLPENPANLSEDKLSLLTDRTKGALRDGGLPCGVAHRLAREEGVPVIALGGIADRLGVRITDCQIGCFKVDKTEHDDVAGKKIDEDVASRIEILDHEGNLICARVFELSRELKVTPMAIADVANAKKLKIHDCQLGCF